MQIIDTLQNLVSGLGIFGKDKAVSSVITFHKLSDVELNSAYRADWIARKIVDIPAKDMTREWRSWQGQKDQITAIEKVEKRLKVRQKVRKAITWARLQGGSALIMDDGARAMDLPLMITRKDGLKALLVLSKRQLKPGDASWDPYSPNFGEPEFYELTTPAGPTKVHASRVIKFVGNPIGDDEDRQSPDDRCWGDSVLQACYEAVVQAAGTNATIASLMAEAKIDVFKIPGLMANVGTAEYRNRMVERWNLAAVVKSVNNALLIDKDEEFDRKEITFTGLSDLQMNFLQIVSGAADIPATRMLSQSPKGMNATGDSDLQNYYDKISSDQENDLSPLLEALDEAMIVSALGSRPDEIFTVWNALKKLSPKEKGELEKSVAETAKIIGDAGLVPTAALEQGFQNKLVEMGVYPGLEQAIEDAKNGVLLPFEDPGAEEEEGAIDPVTGKPKVPSEGEPGGQPAANENGAHEITVNGPGGLSIKARTKAAKRDAIFDAAPRTLYVSRRVLNAEKILAWARTQGFKSLQPPEALHVTTMLSRAPIDWMTVGRDWNEDKEGRIHVTPGGPRAVEALGNKGAVVLLFSSEALAWRHDAILRAGADWPFESYQPHVTLTYEPGDLDVAKVIPYPGELELGPEIFAEVVEDWEKGVPEDKA